MHTFHDFDLLTFWFWCSRQFYG